MAEIRRNGQILNESILQLVPVLDFATDLHKLKVLRKTLLKDLEFLWFIYWPPLHLIHYENYIWKTPKFSIKNILYFALFSCWVKTHLIKILKYSILITNLKENMSNYVNVYKQLKIDTYVCMFYVDSCYIHIIFNCGKYKISWSRLEW